MPSVLSAVCEWRLSSCTTLSCALRPSCRQALSLDNLAFRCSHPCGPSHAHPVRRCLKILPACTSLALSRAIFFLNYPRLPTSVLASSFCQLLRDTLRRVSHDPLCEKRVFHKKKRHFALSSLTPRLQNFAEMFTAVYVIFRMCFLITPDESFRAPLKY